MGVQISALFAAKGDDDYIGEPVSQAGTRFYVCFHGVVAWIELSWARSVLKVLALESINEWISLFFFSKKV